MPRRNLKKRSLNESCLTMSISYEQLLNGKTTNFEPSHTFERQISQNLQCLVNLNQRFSNINSKEKETQHQPYNSSRIPAFTSKGETRSFWFGFYTIKLFQKSNGSNVEYIIFSKCFWETWLPFTCLSLKMNFFQNLKWQTGNRFYNSENFWRRMNNKKIPSSN